MYGESLAWWLYRSNSRFARVDHPVELAPCRNTRFAGTEWRRVAGGQPELSDDGGGNSHRRRQVTLDVLEAAEEEQLVADDAAAAVG